MDGLVLQDAARARGVEQDAQHEADDARKHQGRGDHDEGVLDGVDKRTAQSIPIGLREVGDVHRWISSISVVRCMCA